MFQYQQRNQYFAQIAGGFEEIAGAELSELGAVNLKPAFRGIHFEVDRAALYRINYTARLITRVLAPLITFDCHSDKYLHQTALKLEWDRLLTPANTFSVSATTSNTPSLKHSHYAALKVKDAVCDFFRTKTGERPSVDLQNPDIGIHLFVRNNRATLSIDTSGGSLHKRGYRTARVEAPMSETLAAAVIRLSGWHGERPLADPMSGSGTLLCEAAMSWCRIPAGYLREGARGFERLPDFDPSVWMAVKQKADAALRPLPDHLLIASDIDPAAVRATRRNLNRLPGCKNAFQCDTNDFRNIDRFENTTLVTNPPYGLRLGDRGAAEERMKQLGDFLKQRCTGCTAYVYAGDRPLLKKVGLKPEWKKEIHNGGLEGVLGKFDLY
jgi:putative N6-adenine-specific DNA methylase